MGNSRDKKLYVKTKLTMTGWFNVHYKRMQKRQRTMFGKDLPFDRWDFEKWIIDNCYDKFTKLFDNWVKSNYDNDLCPSIDRIDCCKGYEYSNIQVITWKENNEKGHYEKTDKKINSMIEKSKRPVIKLDKNGNKIEMYVSISEASRKNNISTSIICECCQGKRKTGKGYRWIYA